MDRRRRPARKELLDLGSQGGRVGVALAVVTVRGGTELRPPPRVRLLEALVVQQEGLIEYAYELENLLGRHVQPELLLEGGLDVRTRVPPVEVGEDEVPGRRNRERLRGDVNPIVDDEPQTLLAPFLDGRNVDRP